MLATKAKLFDNLACDGSVRQTFKIWTYSAIKSCLNKNTSPEDTHASLNFGPSWTRVNHTNFSGGSVMRSDSPGSELNFTFTGTGLQFITQTSNAHAAFDIYINDQFIHMVDTHSATLSNQRIVGKIDGLVFGNHKVRIITRATNNGVRVNIDRIDIFQNTLIPTEI